MDETVQSVCNQIYPHWECILVDDGSSDGSWQVVQDWVRKDSRIRGLQQENKERSAARNFGAKHAQGEWLCFLDSDDCYLPDFLSHLAEQIQSNPNPPALWISDFFLWDGDQNRHAHVPPPTQPLADWLCRHPVTPSRACVQAPAFSQFQFREDIVIVEDTVLWVQLLSRFRLGYLPRPLMQYRIHEGNSVHSSSRAVFKRWQGLKAFFKTPEARLVSPNMRATRILGRIVNVGRLGGMKAEFDADLHALRRITYTGVTFRTRTPDEVAAINTAMVDDLWPLLSERHFAMPIDSVFELGAFEDALSRMRANAHFGKIVLRH